MQDVVVVGAGVVGLLTAHYLNELGYTVTVLERAPECASESSHANAGQLSYSFADPLAGPGLLRALPKALLRLDPAIRVSFDLDLDYQRWIYAVLRESTTGRATRNGLALLRLALKSRSLMQPFHAAFGDEYDYRKAGKMVLLERLTKEAREGARRKTLLGCEQRVLSREAACEQEPALADIQNWAGALYAPDDEIADAQRFCRALEKRLRAAGVVIAYETSATRVDVQAGRVSGLALSRAGREDRLDTRRVILCAGWQNDRLVPAPARDEKPAPIYPVAGYSLTQSRTQTVFQSSITLLRERMVFSAFDERVRLAGFADLGAQAAAPRINALLDRARTVAPTLAEGLTPESQPWAGFRPCTPSSLPNVGRTHIQGLYTNAGHGMLGWTLAAATGHAVANDLDADQGASSPSSAHRAAPGTQVAASGA